MKLQPNLLYTSQGYFSKRSATTKNKLLTKRLNRNPNKNNQRVTTTPTKQSSELPLVQQVEKLQITEKSKTGKIIRMFGVEELYNIEEDKKTKVKALSSEIIVAIPKKLGRKKFKTYLGLIDSGTSPRLIDKHLASTNGLDANATPSKEKWLTQ